jgi:hypothetical protein
MAGAPPTPTRVVLAGVTCALIVVNRPPDLLLAAPFVAIVPWWTRSWRTTLLLALSAAIPLAAAGCYNQHFAGAVSGGYGHLLRKLGGYGAFFRFPLLPGLAGLLVSPGKGLLVYAPFFLFLPLALWRIPRDRRWLAGLLATGCLLQVLMYAKSDWRGGYSYGPRYLTDLLPIAVWLLAPVVQSLRKAGLSAFILAGVFSVWVQVVGAFWYPAGASDLLYYNGGAEADDTSGAWVPNNVGFLVEFERGTTTHPEALVH